MPIAERSKLVANLMLCYNCLPSSHQVNLCRFGGCKKCGKEHNTRLHEYQVPHQVESKISAEPEAAPSSSNAVLYVQKDLNIPNAKSSLSCAMLATTIVYINDASNIPQRCRAVLDSGSQVNFMTLACANKLQLQSTNKSISIAGIGAKTMLAKCLQPSTLSGRYGQYTTEVIFYSLPVISSSLPINMLNVNNICLPENVQSCLADPNFHEPSSVDCLLGADIFYELFEGTRIAITEQLTAHNTKLGWIITGRTFEATSYPTVSARLATVNCQMNSQAALSLYVTKATTRGIEEAAAEKHFVSSIQRDETGRFMVRLPLSQDPSSLGDSLVMAQRRFFNVE